MSNSYNDVDAQLVPFLRELADSIESKQLPQEYLKRIGEFYMNYKLQEELANNDKDNPDKELEDMDIIKFITLGWWIYKHLNNEDDNEDDNEDAIDKLD